MQVTLCSNVSNEKNFSQNAIKKIKQNQFKNNNFVLNFFHVEILYGYSAKNWKNIANKAPIEYQIRIFLQ